MQVVSGGVASNQYVRARLNEVVARNSFQLVCPPPSLCTDNGILYYSLLYKSKARGVIEPSITKLELELDTTTRA